MSGADGHIGVAFDNGGVIYYGYIRMITTGPKGFPAQLLEYGYNSVGGLVTIPNP